MSATVDFSKILFRASCMGDIMSAGKGEITPTQLKTITTLVEKAKVKKLTDIQSEELFELCYKRDNPQLGDTCKKRLIKIYAKAAYDREEEISSKQMEKGTLVEAESRIWLSVLKEKLFRENTLRVTNKYLTGKMDSFDGPDDDIMNAEEIIDFKSPWSLETYLAAKYEKTMDKAYEWQGHSYLALIPKAKRFRLVYSLQNSPGQIIADEKRKMAWTMRQISDESRDPDYVAACCQIERNHIFDIERFRELNPGFVFHNDEWQMDWNIPVKERIHEMVLERNDAAINAMYRKIDWCRKWMSENCI